jgi:hypothetical protein
MVAAVIAQGLVALAIALPWLTMLPIHGAAGAGAHAITLVAACHGAGLVVGRLVQRRTAGPWLVIQWGIATLIGLSGLAITVGIATLATQAILVFGFAAVHSVSLTLGFADCARRIADRGTDGTARPLSWLIPALALAGLGAVAVLGAADDPIARPFDDEGHAPAQLRRVLDTGALADPIGYPRRSQLGGQIALAAVASGAGDGVAEIIEKLALVLALGLAISRIGARDPVAALWAVVLVVAAFALALAPTDPLPCWTAVGLIVALYVMLGDADPPPALPLAVTAGALIALRYEFAPIAAVAVITAWLRRRNDHPRTAILIGGVFAVAFPFLVTRMVAWRSVPMMAQAMLALPHQAPVVVRLAIAALIALPTAGLLHLILPGHGALRAPVLATAVALGAVAIHLVGAGPYALRLTWPIAIGFAIALVIELARSRAAGAAALVTALALCAVIYEGREAPGRLRWARRLATAASGIEYLQRPAGVADGVYAELLAKVPPDVIVAVWVSAPEQLDYASHRIIDLRVPVVARMRRHRSDSQRSQLEPLLAQLSAGFLLLEGDDLRLQRARNNLVYGAVCRTALAICADDLEVIAFDHRVVARRDNLELIELRH